MQDGNTGKDPLTTDGWWSRVSPTNRWKPFDLSSTTRLQLTGPAYYEINCPTPPSAPSCLLTAMGCPVFACG